MPFYEFIGEDCPNAAHCPNRPDGKMGVCHHTIRLPVSKLPKLGARRKCPAGCHHYVKRVVSSEVGIIVRGSTLADWKPSQTFTTRVNGQDIHMTFVDHPHTDPAYQRNLSRLAKVGGIESQGLANAHIDEHYGRPVVQVVSNVPDPLGVIARARKNGEYTAETRKINQPYKVRRTKRK